MCTLKNKYLSLTSAKGFTLLETAIVITVLGLILAAILMPYNLWRTNKITRITDTNINIATAALTNYLVQKGNYPCPARLTARRGDADYGMASECNPLQAGYPAVATAGTFQNGFYFEDGVRADADIDPDPAVNNPITPKIRRGSIPFRTLGLGEDQVEDGYGMRLQYAVTENLAVASTYVETSGGISIIDGNGNSLVNPPPPTPKESAHYVIFSTGKDRMGAYTRAGIQVTPCAAVGKDSENCNTTGAGATDMQAIYSHAAYSLASGANHYDDFLKFYSSVETPLWRVADAAGLHIRDLIAAEVTGKIGVGVSNPTDTVQVLGETRAGDVVAKSMVDTLCDEDGVDCFNSQNFGLVAGHDDFKCGTAANPGQYGTGFSLGQIDCSNTVSVRCPPGDRLMGINPDGSLNCDQFTGCPSKNITLCGAGNIVNLPASLAKGSPDLGGTSNGWTPYFGLSYREKWECKGKGKWKRKKKDGICSCIPSVKLSSKKCNDKKKGNWTGFIQYKKERVCPSGKKKKTELSDNCVCTPLTKLDSKSCPKGFSGNIPRERVWSCSSPDKGKWSKWKDVLDALHPTKMSYCTCTATTEQKSFGCPAGQTGVLTKERDFDCSTGKWSNWDAKPPLVNTCACDATIAPQSADIACTAPLVGTVIRLQNWDCSLNGGMGGWDAPYEISNNCGVISYSYRAKSVSTGQLPGALPVSLGETCFVPGDQKACSSPAGGGNYWHYPLCQCE